MRKPDSPSTHLRALEALRLTFGRRAGAQKRLHLRALERLTLPRASEVLRLHELLCLWRAYPDDPAMLRLVDRMLRGFSVRADLLRHAKALTDSGIAGAEIRFSFFAPTARWLAGRWPERLSIDWPNFENVDRLATWLPLLASPAEIPALDELDLPVRDWIRRMRGRTSDAAFLARRFGELPMSDEARDILYDELDPPWVLSPGPDTPSRTLARSKPPPRGVVFQRGPLSRSRPSAREIERMRPGVVREVTPREGQRLVDLAREAMVTRTRDLDVFSYGDPRDVRLVDFPDGLQFACIGAVPERRLLLEAVYGYLTLKNGVPIGYVLTSALFNSSEIAYNVFDTWRGAEAGLVYGRVLAMTRQLFGSNTFAIFPYQLGEGNDEAIESGAWWFYQKSGFRPLARSTVSLMDRELARMKRAPGHRSSAATLKRLARHTMFLHLNRRRDDVIGTLELPYVGLHAMRFLSRRFGADRERGAAECVREAISLLGLASLDGFSSGERLAFERWAPLVLALPGVERWSAAERRALAEVVRAKGGLRESEFVRRFDAHRKLRRAIEALAKTEPR